MFSDYKFHSWNSDFVENVQVFSNNIADLFINSRGSRISENVIKL